MENAKRKTLDAHTPKAAYAHPMRMSITAVTKS